MYLRVRRTGEVEVSAAPRVERKMIESFIVSKWSWVQAKRNQALLSLEKQLQADEIFYFGQRVTIKRHPAKKYQLNEGKRRCIFLVPQRMTMNALFYGLKTGCFASCSKKLNS